MLNLSLNPWIGAILVLVAGLVGQAFYNVFLSPLRSIPGPFLAKITQYWLTFVDLAGCRVRTLHELHRKYGHTVRIGPNEISFSNQEIIKELYSPQTNFIKAPAYETMSVKPLGIFSLRDKKAHSQRRRLLSHAFSQANLLDTQPLIREHIKTFLSIIKPRLGQPIDMLYTFRLLSFDIVGELFLGQSFDGLKSTKPPQFLLDLDTHFILAGIQQSFPLIYYLLPWLPIPAIQHFCNARKRAILYGKERFEKYIAQYGRDSSRRDLLSKIVSSKNQDNTGLTDVDCYTEIGNLVFAGTDTTSTTLTYLFWQLAKYPEWQSRLRAELKNAGPWADGIPEYKDVVDLPVLEAVINEGLRLYPAAPSSLMRETPAGGRVLNDIFIPEKTVVSMQCYTTQRDPDVFHEPDSFLPERWLDAKAVTPEMKTMMMPFSVGSRACLGISLAWMELKVITSALVQIYEVSLAPGTTDESMTFWDHFLAAPKAGKCDLIFTEAKG